MNIAIVGTGSIAAEHVAALRELREDGWPELRLVAVVGRDLRSALQFAHAHGIETEATDLGRVLARSPVDAVIACSPTDLHARQTEQVLLAGKDVLCEIPLATSLAETDRLIALARRRDRILMVAHTQRFYPALMEARARIERGALHPTAIVSRYLFDRRNRVNWKGRTRSWTDNLLWHHGGHAVDAALWLLGASEVETVAQIADPDPALGIPMNLSLAMRTPANQIATVAMSYQARLPRHDYLLIGQETTLEFVDNRLIGEDGVIVAAPGEDPLHDALPRQDAAFLTACATRAEPPSSARAIRPAMAALQTAQNQLDARREGGGRA